ncbi:unnamed protein product [Rotaria magnacalcarata]|uniref:Uncharacterized protein n=1 Tax=Rotaria magnacalcarata TaxID=392030 RepID=A0A8S3EZ06_9BILA|nr:unnamed protein product [Rotaria magnacalcarata]
MIPISKDCSAVEALASKTVVINRVFNIQPTILMPSPATHYRRRSVLLSQNIGKSSNLKFQSSKKNTCTTTHNEQSLIKQNEFGTYYDRYIVLCNIRNNDRFNNTYFC